MKSARISSNQFIVDCINKAFELAHTEKHWDSFDDLVEYSNSNPEWYLEAEFTEVSQYNLWRDYCISHMSNWRGKSFPKYLREQEFNWLELQYGPKYSFTFNIKDLKNGTNI